MAEDKKGFILYADQRGTFAKLSDEQAGKLVKHIFSYVNDENPESDFITELAFESIKQKLKRDLVKWEATRGKRSEAGLASAASKKLAKQQTSTKSTSVESVQQTSTKSTVKDNVNVNVSVNDSVKGKEIKVYSNEINECFDNCLNYFPPHLHPKDHRPWIETIDKLNRIDNIPFSVIEDVVRKTRNDEFWSAQFLSLTKLRKTNKEGIKYIIVFNEKFKSNKDEKRNSIAELANSIRSENPNI